MLPHGHPDDPLGQIFGHLTFHPPLLPGQFCLSLNMLSPLADEEG